MKPIKSLFLFLFVGMLFACEQNIVPAKPNYYQYVKHDTLVTEYETDEIKSVIKEFDGKLFVNVYQKEYHNPIVIRSSYVDDMFDLNGCVHTTTTSGLNVNFTINTDGIVYFGINYPPEETWNVWRIKQ